MSHAGLDILGNPHNRPAVVDTRGPSQHPPCADRAGGQEAVEVGCRSPIPQSGVVASADGEGVADSSSQRAQVGKRVNGRIGLAGADQ